MQRRALLALALLGAALVLAVLGRAALPDVLDPLAGLCLVAAAGVGLSLLPALQRARPLPMPGLFARPDAHQRWCSICGRPAPPGICPTCHTASRRERRRQRRLTRPKAPRGQEKKA